MIARISTLALLLAAAACTQSAPANNGAAPPNVAAPAPPPAPPANLAKNVTTTVGAEAEEPEDAVAPEPKAAGCTGEIGLAEARELVAQCREVSPATRPPCNVANSCAMIEDEIARGCEMLAEDAPAFCEG